MVDEKLHIVDAMLRKLGEESERAKARYATIPRMPKWVPAECTALWTDVRFSLTFGRFHAALSTCIVFVESFLSTAITEFEARNGLTGPAPDDLSAKINRACRIGLVSKAEKKLLHMFRVQVRNRVFHGDLIAVANSFAELQKATLVRIRAGQVTVTELTSDALTRAIRATSGLRLEIAVEKLSLKVVRWVGLWAVACSHKVWGAAAPAPAEGKQAEPGAVPDLGGM